MEFKNLLDFPAKKYTIDFLLLVITRIGYDNLNLVIHIDIRNLD